MLAELSATRPLSVREQKRLQALGVILNQEGRVYLYFVGGDCGSLNPDMAAKLQSVNRPLHAGGR